MNNTSRQVDKMRAILVLLATLGTIAFNWIAALGYLNNTDTGAISDKYETLVTPAGYAFSIWSLIYVGIVAFSIYQLLPANAERFRSVRTPYILTCLLNCSWLYSWHHEYIVASLIIIICLWSALLWTYTRVAGCRSTVETWTVQAPFGLYIGWVTAASLVNLAITLRYLNIDFSPAGDTVLAIILILLAAAIGVAARVTLRNFFIPLAVAWALAAIAVKQSGQTGIVVASAVGVVACLIAALSFVLALNSTQNE